VRKYSFDRCVLKKKSKFTFISNAKRQLDRVRDSVQPKECRRHTFRRLCPLYLHHLRYLIHCTCNTNTPTQNFSGCLHRLLLIRNFVIPYYLYINTVHQYINTSIPSIHLYHLYIYTIDASMHLYIVIRLYIYTSIHLYSLEFERIPKRERERERERE